MKNVYSHNLEALQEHSKVVPTSHTRDQNIYNQYNTYNHISQQNITKSNRKTTQCDENTNYTFSSSYKM